MTLIPSEQPSPDSGDRQTVSVRRRGSAEPMPGGTGAVGGIDLGSLASGVFGQAKQSLLKTAKGMLVLAVVLTAGAAWWAGQISGWRGFAAVLLVGFPCFAIALVAAAKRAASAMSGVTARQTRMGSTMLKDLLDEVAKRANDGGGEPSPLVRTDAAVEALSAIASARGQTDRPRPVVFLFSPSQSISKRLLLVVKPSFRQLESGGQLNLDRVREALGPTIDDQVADAIASEARQAVLGAVLTMVLWSAMMAYLLRLV